MVEMVRGGAYLMVGTPTLPMKGGGGGGEDKMVVTISAAGTKCRSRRTQLYPMTPTDTAVLSQSY
jgi:hypothetical protein